MGACYYEHALKASLAPPEAVRKIAVSAVLPAKVQQRTGTPSTPSRVTANAITSWWQVGTVVLGGAVHSGAGLHRAVPSSTVSARSMSSSATSSSPVGAGGVDEHDGQERR